MDRKQLLINDLKQNKIQTPTSNLIDITEFLSETATSLKLEQKIVKIIFENQNDNTKMLDEIFKIYEEGTEEEYQANIFFFFIDHYDLELSENEKRKRINTFIKFNDLEIEYFFEKDTYKEFIAVYRGTESIDHISDGRSCSLDIKAAKKYHKNIYFSIVNFESLIYVFDERTCLFPDDSEVILKEEKIKNMKRLSHYEIFDELDFNEEENEIIYQETDGEILIFEYD